MTRLNQILWLSVAILCALTVIGCATAPFKPASIHEIRFRERAQSQSDGDIRVSVAVLSTEESKELFGVDLADNGIQAVWLKVENYDNAPYWFLRSGMDPEHFSPLETSYVNHSGFTESARTQMDRYFEDLYFKNPIPPNTAVSGFVYVNLDEGVKGVDVDLYSPKAIKKFAFYVRIPGFKHDVDDVDFEGLYPKEDITHFDNFEDLRRALESLPCCTTDVDGTKNGDPLNLIFIGTREDIAAALERRGWDPTEQMYVGSMEKTVTSFLFGSLYRYAPVSSLYVYGRKQDAAIQRVRSTIHMRNHLRSWLTPMRFRGKPVWVGQISRDIGVRFTTKVSTLTTHKIDPNVDEARDGLLGDLFYSQALAKFGYVKGIGPAPRDEPRQNLTGDPYYTDGFRMVLFFERRQRLSLTDIEFIEWERPRSLEQLRE